MAGSVDDSGADAAFVFGQVANRGDQRDRSEAKTHPIDDEQYDDECGGCVGFNERKQEETGCHHQHTGECDRNRADFGKQSSRKRHGNHDGQ